VVTLALKYFKKVQEHIFSQARWFNVPTSCLQYPAAKQQVHAAQRKDQNWKD